MTPQPQNYKFVRCRPQILQFFAGVPQIEDPLYSPSPPPLKLLQKPVSNFLVKVIPGELASETKLTPWRLLAEVVPKTRTPGDLDSEVELKFAISINENVNSVSSKIKSSLVPSEDVETSIR